MKNMENDNFEKMVKGLAGLALVSIGFKNFKHPSFFTGLAVITGGYLLYKAVKAIMPEAETGEDYEEPDLQEVRPVTEYV